MIIELKAELERVATDVGATFSSRSNPELQDFAQQFDFATPLINLRPIENYNQNIIASGAIRYDFQFELFFLTTFVKSDHLEDTKDVLIDEMVKLSELYFTTLNKNENRFFINPSWNWTNNILRQHLSNLTCGIKAVIFIDTACNKVDDSGSSKEFYVRPLGGSYGLEDGSSYENAWNGFSNVELMPDNSVLFIAGTHIELYTVSQDNLTVRGDSPSEAGVIDSEGTRAICMKVLNKQNVTINALSLINATTSCLSLEGTSTVVTNDIIVTNGTGQGVQHQDTVVATHNGLMGSLCPDEVISCHDLVNVTIDGGSFINNGAAYNAIETAVLTVLGDVTYTNNTNDALINGGSFAGSVNATFTDQIFTSIVSANSGGFITLNNCTVPSLQSFFATHASEVTANDCIIETASIQAGSSFFMNVGILKGFGTRAGTIELRKVRVVDNITDMNTSTVSLLARHCLFFDTSTGITVRIRSGATADIRYCVIHKTASNQQFRVDAGANIIAIDNITQVGESNGSNGLITLEDATINNFIVTDTNKAINESSGNLVINNACLFNNTTDISGTPTSNDQVSTDPKLLDVSNKDYSLDTGSSCIGTGKTLTEATGIDTADWGDGVSVLPVVTTKEQANDWDIGAYVS